MKGLGRCKAELIGRGAVRLTSSEKTQKAAPYRFFQVFGEVVYSSPFLLYAEFVPNIFDIQDDRTPAIRFENAQKVR